MANQFFVLVYMEFLSAVLGTVWDWIQVPGTLRRRKKVFSYYNNNRLLSDTKKSFMTPPDSILVGDLRGIEDEQLVMLLPLSLR